MMKNKILVFGAMLLWLAVPARGQNLDDWVGLWRLNRYSGDKIDAVNHILISAPAQERVAVYSHAFQVLDVQRLQLQVDSMDLTYASTVKQPVPLVIQVSRAGNVLTGEWSYRHYQMKEAITGRLEGIRVYESADWDPWETVNRNRGRGVVDVYGFLAKNAPVADFDEFLKFWDLFEPSYYAFVQQWLYEGHSDLERTRKEFLEKAHSYLKDSEQDRSWIEEFPGMAQQAFAEVETLDRSGEGTIVVSTFSGSPYRLDEFWSSPPDPQAEIECSCTLDLRERFITIDPTTFVSLGDWGKVALWKQLYQALLLTSARRVDADFMLVEGLAISLALSRGEMEWDTSGAERLEEVRRQWSRYQQEETAGGRPLDFRESSQSLLAYSFFKDVSAERSVRELLGLRRRELNNLWSGYLEKLESKASR